MSNSYVDVIEQAIELLNDMSVDDYQAVAQPHFSSSIGAHIRHVVDHFMAIINIDEHAEIDYNKRDRHGQVEQCPQQAISALEQIVTWLLQTCKGDLSKQVWVTSEIDITCTESNTCPSSLERELVFAASHAIHHYALIRIVRSMQGQAVPEFFGYAPATITHLTRSA